MSDLPDIALTRDPLDTAQAAARVTGPDAGGVAIFLGITRAEKGPGGNLVALDYHAYDEMALKELSKLVDLARARWPVRSAVIWHRLGAVNVGEASVIVAVSCRHRAAAFEACAWIMDELKKLVPIWKREVFEHGAKWKE